MAIQDDFTLDALLKRVFTTQTYVNGKPPNIYSANAFYTWLQDESDEPSRMVDTVPISAQTSLQYRMENAWFVDDETLKSLYGGSLETAGWLKSGAAGITLIRFTAGSTDAPTNADIGVTLTGGTSTATGVLLHVDQRAGPLRIAYVRNTSAAQFSANENITGTGVDMQSETTDGIKNGEFIYGNLFTVGSVQPETEIVVGQEDDYLGGTAEGGGGTYPVLTSIAPWWDVDVDFATVSPNPVNIGGIDVLVKVQEAGALIDAGRIEVDARQLTVLYSAFKLLLTGGQGVGVLTVPGQDLNAATGVRRVGISTIVNGPVVVGDVIQDTVGGQSVNRAVITAVETGPDVIEYYLIGDLTDFVNADTVFGKSPSTLTFTIATAVEAFSTVNQAVAGGIVVTPGHIVGDIDQDSVNEPYALLINCNSVRLFDVYPHVQYLARRGATAGILPDYETGASGEAGEFYEAVGEVLAIIDAEGGTGIAQGTVVTGSLSGATAVVVAKEFTTFNYVVLTQVKGVFVDNDILDLLVSPVGNTNTIAGTPSLLASQTANPFGQFAGGQWFLARGVLLSNVNALDANSFQTTDILGVLKVPPTQISIVVNGTAAGDRIIVPPVTAAGAQTILTSENGVSGTPAQGATAITLDSTPAADKPTSETLHIIDGGFDERYRVLSFAGAVATLVNANFTGTCTAGSDIDSLFDSGATFQTDGVEIGMLVGKTLQSGNSREIFKVIRVVSETELDLAPWEGSRVAVTAWVPTTDTYIINALAYAKAGTEDAYIPYMDRISAGVQETISLTYVSDREVLARDRFSSTIVGGQKILPFEQLNIQLTSSGLTIAARRDSDNIAAV